MSDPLERPLTGRGSRLAVYRKNLTLIRQTAYKRLQNGFYWLLWTLVVLGFGYWLGRMSI